MPSPPSDIEALLRGDFVGTETLQQVTEKLLGNQKRVLEHYWGPKSDKVEGFFLKFTFFRISAFPYTIHTEHRKLLFIFCTGVLKRCGISLFNGSTVDVEPITEPEVESILSDTEFYNSTSRFKAFVLVRISILILFTIGAYRHGIAVANLCLHLHLDPKNWQSKIEPWTAERERLLMMMRSLISATYNNSEDRYFDENEVFSKFPNPSEYSMHCRHGIALDGELVKRCIFADCTDPHPAWKICN